MKPQNSMLMQDVWALVHRVSAAHGFSADGLDVFRQSVGLMLANDRICGIEIPERMTPKLEQRIWVLARCIQTNEKGSAS